MVIVAPTRGYRPKSDLGREVGVGYLPVALGIAGNDPGLRDSLRDPSLSGTITEEEAEFLKHLRFTGRRKAEKPVTAAPGGGMGGRY
jgi:hypothetical protein